MMFTAYLIIKGIQSHVLGTQCPGPCQALYSLPRFSAITTTPSPHTHWD